MALHRRHVSAHPLTAGFTETDVRPYRTCSTTSVATLLPDVMLLIRINAVYGWRAPCTSSLIALLHRRLIFLLLRSLDLLSTGTLFFSTYPAPSFPLETR